MGLAPLLRTATYGQLHFLVKSLPCLSGAETCAQLLKCGKVVLDGVSVCRELTACSGSKQAGHCKRERANLVPFPQPAPCAHVRMDLRVGPFLVKNLLK